MIADYARNYYMKNRCRIQDRISIKKKRKKEKKKCVIGEIDH